MKSILIDEKLHKILKREALERDTTIKKLIEILIENIKNEQH